MTQLRYAGEIWVAVAIALFPSHLVAQDSRSDPKAAGSSTKLQQPDRTTPTLRDTLGWMKNTIASEGNFRYRFCPNDKGLDRYSEQRVILEVVDFSDCKLTWKDWHIAADADPGRSGTTKIVPLGEIDRGAIRVETAADLRKRAFKNDRELYTDIPERWHVAIQGRNNRKVINQRGKDNSYWTDSDGVEFIDQSIAQRWAKALGHAVTLCSSDSKKRKGPF